MNPTTKKELIEKSFADAYQLIINKYNTEQSLKFFLEEFQHEIIGDFQILTLRLTNDDYLKLIDRYNSLDYELPKLSFSLNGYYTVKHFIREIGEYSIVSNITGFKNQEKPVKVCLFFDYELIRATSLGIA